MFISHKQILAFHVTTRPCPPISIVTTPGTSTSSPPVVTRAGPPVCPHCRCHHRKGCPTRLPLTGGSRCSLHYVHSSQTNPRVPRYNPAMPTNLHRHYGAGYLHFLTTSCYQRRPLLGTARNRDLFLEVMEQVRAPSLRRRRLCSHARARPPSFQRAGARQPIARHGRAETELRAPPAVPASRPNQSAARRALEHASRSWTHLAKAFLRFRGLHFKEASGEAELHASQSGHAYKDSLRLKRYAAHDKTAF